MSIKGSWNYSFDEQNGDVHMLELTNLLTTIAGCSATVIAIVGGFIASKLIALSTEREEVLARLFEIEEEISFKSKKAIEAKEALDEDDALDFIKENIESAVLGQSLDMVYKKEARLNISEEELNPYWSRAVKISKKLFDVLINTDEEVNDDGVPNILAAEIEADFEYTVCKYAVKYIERIHREQERAGSPYSINLPIADFVSDNLPRLNGHWYQKTRDEMNEANASIEWLKIQRHQLLARKNALEKPKGMKSGLVVFGLFSLFGVLTPLIFIPFSTENYRYYFIVKCSAIGIFAIGLFSVFIYLITLLKWKKRGH